MTRHRVCVYLFSIWGGGVRGGVQSLSGFLGRCNIKTPETHSGGSLLSAPLPKCGSTEGCCEFGYGGWFGGRMAAGAQAVTL